MQKSVDAIIDDLIGREGGYSNHSADRGGATKWGITEQVARAFGYNGAMKALPREDAVAIYRDRYWHQPRLDDVAVISDRVAVKMFDIGVNMGTSVPVTFLQRSLNLLNQGAGVFPDLVVDGAIGAVTLDALRRYQVKRGRDGEIVLLRCLSGLQLARYADIAERRPANEAFFYGWVFNRVGEL